ncbi:MAG TPA: cysteine dioxygenase [Ramlibacter sp.]|nr:cysteine dioxygenase [Ramlibacter sp.]
MQNPPARLKTFIRELGRVSQACANEESRMLATGRELLKDLVAHDDWLPDAYAQPHPEYYRQYLLHLDPMARFSIVSFVWGPGQQTPVHDHTVWGLIGMLRGGEVGERFECTAEGRPMRSLGSETLLPGNTDQVSPAVGDVHQVRNLYQDRVSISIHVYGADIGRVSRHVYDPSTGTARTFISGYSEPVASS